MRGTGILLLALISGCITKALWTTPSKSRPPKLSGETECHLDLAAPDGNPALAFAVTPPRAPPKRMRTEFGRGRTCLLLRSPYSLSFAGTCVLEGEALFRPETVTVNFAQTRTKHGTRRDPALLRIEGPMPDAMKSRVEPCDEPSVRHTLEEVHDPDVRVLLGHGIDTLVSLVADPRPTDVVSWCGVEGPEPDWRLALDLARARDSLAPLEPYRVVVRRWRDGGSTCFRLHLADVILASQMSFQGNRYTWEGLWICSLELPEGRENGLRRDPVAPPVRGVQAGGERQGHRLARAPDARGAGGRPRARAPRRLARKRPLRHERPGPEAQVIREGKKGGAGGAPRVLSGPSVPRRRVS